MAQKKDPNMKELTKEGIYQQATLEQLSNASGTRMDVIYAAMDFYAKQEAIGFAEFTRDEKALYVFKNGIWIPYPYTDKTPTYTTEQLYSLYIQNKPQ